MGLNQNEERRGTVLAGRALHKRHEQENRVYIPASLSGEKLVGIRLYSKTLDLSGQIDEAIELSKELVLIERKYSDYVAVSDTLRVQIGLLALLLEENLGKPVTRAKIIFSKTSWKELEVLVDDSVRDFALKMLHEAREVVKLGIEPEERANGRCINCCFRKTCSAGSLYIRQ
jgi:CRISPR-associated protein Cas4